MEKNRWWIAIPAAFLVMIANIVIAVLWVAVYSHLIDPGHDEAYYEAYAQTSVPYSAIIAGMPLMFLAGRLIGSKFPKGNSVKAALLVWLIYFLIDFSIIALTGKLVHRTEATSVKGVNRVRLNMYAYANGTYLLTLVDQKGKRSTLKLVKE